MAKTPEHFLSRRAFLHMFAIIISWLVFIPAIYSPHGPACPARARGLLGNDRGAVGVVFTVFTWPQGLDGSQEETLWGYLVLQLCSSDNVVSIGSGSLTLAARVRRLGKDKTRTDWTALSDRPCSSPTHSCHSGLSNVHVCLIEPILRVFHTTGSFWGATFRIPGRSKEWWNRSSSRLIPILETHGHAD